jgi:hypothetical protein
VAILSGRWISGRFRPLRGSNLVLNADVIWVASFDQEDGREDSNTQQTGHLQTEANVGGVHIPKL